MVEVENKIQRYDSYKESGVAWLGEIPKHWKIERAKWLFIKNERPIRKEDEIVTCFRDGEVTLRSKRKKSGFTVALKEHGYQGIRKGDLVIHAMDAFAGAIGVSDSDGKSTPVYSACTERFPNTVNQYYYSYFLRSLALNGIILALAKGIRERSTDFRFSDFGELLLSFPPLPEQTKIAQFLDDKTTKIADAIAIKQQQINLLKERKQILIHKAVTRGLDDRVTLKDSGVEWIGEIPAHWEVKRFKIIAKANKGKLPNKIVSNTDNTLPPYMSMEYLRGGIENQWVLDKDAIVINSDETLLLWDGSNSGEFIKSRKGVISSTVAHIVFKGINENYAWYHSKVLERELRGNTIGMGIPHVNGKFLNNLSVLLPPLSEQKEISEYIETASQKIETAIGLKQQEIAKLKEYKSSLINGVVTGKVKVC